MTSKNNTFNYKNKDILQGQNKTVNIPHNFFEKSQNNYKNDIFYNKFKEKRNLEQFFWTSDTVKKILNALFKIE